MNYFNKFYSLIVFGISLSLCSSTFEDLCDVSNDCEGKDAGTLVQDPLDCHSFYQCIVNSNGEVVVSNAGVTCPSGKYFNEENHQCADETFHCANKCSNLFCPKTCDGLADGTLIAFPNDCNQFQVCFNGADPVFGTCSDETPYFNGTDCTTDLYSCCNICTPYCKNEFTQVEDLVDCHSFYLCESDDYIPGNYTHFECEVGMNFDRTLGECVEGYECTSIC